MLTFERRYIFTGKLVLKTALHIGGGEGTVSPSDSPVLRGPDLKPFIPGSSLKGSLRSTVERLVPAIPGLRTCALIDGEGGVGNQPCPGAPGGAQRHFNQRRRDGDWSEDKLLTELEALCDTCKLFGSPFRASKAYFDDLPIAEWVGTTQIRDGVAIDRDSERARDRLLYNYEVVAPTSVFAFRLTLEEPTNTDVGLTCLGVSEFVAGFGGVGGLRSRGLGRFSLDDLQILELDLSDDSTRAERLKRYLVGRTAEEKMTPLPDAAVFLRTAIERLLEVAQPC